MIQHIVLLKLKPGTTDEQVNEAFEAGSHLPDLILGVLEVSFGRDRSEPEHGFAIAAIVQLRDEEALRTYLDHPLRRGWIEKHIDPVTEERIDIDVPTEGSHRPDRALATWYWDFPARPRTD